MRLRRVIQERNQFSADSITKTKPTEKGPVEYCNTQQWLFLFTLLFSLFAKHTLIQEPKHPKRHLVVEDIFCVVLDHIAVFDIFNLFLSLFPATHLKGLAVNLKIRDR